MKKLIFIGIIGLCVPLQPAWAGCPQPPSHFDNCLGLVMDVVTAPCQILATCLGFDGTAPRCVGPKYKPPKDCGYSSTRKAAAPAQEIPVTRQRTDRPRAERTAGPQMRPASETVTPPRVQERVARPPRVQAPAEAPPMTRSPEPSAGPPRVTAGEGITPEPRPSSSPAVPLRPAPQARPETKEQPKSRTPVRGYYWSPCVPMPPPCF